MATLRGFDRKFYMSSTTTQATWGTLEAAADLHPFRVNSDPFTIAPEFVNDTDQIGGYEEASLQQELARGVSGPLTQTRAVAAFLGPLLANALGTSGDSLVDTSAYRHIIVPTPASFVMPTFSALDLFTATYYIAYHNLAIDSLELSTQRKGWLDVTAQCIGSGKTAIAGVTVGSLGVAPAMGPALKAGDLYIFQGVDQGAGLPVTYAQGTENMPGTATTIATTIRSFRWRVNNGLLGDEAYEPGTGVLRGRAERERMSQSLSFTVEFADNTYLAYLTSQNNLGLEFQFVSSTLAGAATVYYGLNLAFPSVKLTSCTVTGGVGTLIASCEALVLHDGTGPTVQATIFDKTAAYLG
uniref:Tail protein n=1 Tax=viral metagenome TaxID=1070528 RepID=A0A6M3L9E3_9ZZZZ